MVPDPEYLKRLLNGRTRRSLADPTHRSAAVLIGLRERTDGMHFILTRRTDYVDTHKGQVAFPGGIMEEGESPEETALREAEEEIGLRAEEIDILGIIDDMKTPTGFIITPVVGVVRGELNLIPNSAEVARIFCAPVALFVSDANARVEERILDGIPRTVYFYDYDGEVIWGVTAHIIRMFLGLLPPLAPQ